MSRGHSAPGAEGEERDGGASLRVCDFAELGRLEVARLGLISSDVLLHWPESVTREVVLTGERRAHYLREHPEMADYEVYLAETALTPDEVHCNKRDPDMAICYRRLDSERFLRVALWISPGEGRSNSIHSYRLARTHEVEIGRRQGRALRMGG